MTPSYRKHQTLTRDEAKSLAIRALGFLAADETRLLAFLNVTGLTPAAIRQQASSPEFLSGVLDFLMSDNSLLLVFTANEGLDPNLIAAARRALMPNHSAEE